jgi:hypothetical protein
MSSSHQLETSNGGCINQHQADVIVEFRSEYGIQLRRQKWAKHSKG